MHDLKVWPGVEGDGGEPTTTPGRTSSSLSEDQMGRLAKVWTVNKEQGWWCVLFTMRHGRGRQANGKAWDGKLFLKRHLFQGPNLEVLSDVSTNGRAANALCMCECMKASVKICLYANLTTSRL